MATETYLASKNRAAIAHDLRQRLSASGRRVRTDSVGISDRRARLPSVAWVKGAQTHGAPQGILAGQNCVPAANKAAG